MERVPFKQGEPGGTREKFDRTNEIVSFEEGVTGECKVEDKVLDDLRFQREDNPLKVSDSANEASNNR